MERRVGVVGLGPMGRAMVSSLLSAGYEPTVWDRDVEKVATTAALGASTAVDAGGVAAASDVVFTALPDDAAVTEVALGPGDGARDGGVLAGLAEGGVLVDTTTASPLLADRLDTAFTAAGRRFLDAPVSGRLPHTSVLLGAREGEFDDVEDVLRDVSSTLVFCGPRGAGYAAKLVNQHVKYGWYLASCEALLVARRHGLDPAVAVEAVRRSSGAGRGFDDAAAHFLGDAVEVARHGPVRTIAKDMALAEALADATGVRAPVLRAVSDFFACAVHAGYADRPYPDSAAVLDGVGDGRAAHS